MPEWKPKPVVVWLLIAASLALRWPGMVESLWFDEVFRTRVVLTSQGIWDLLLHDVHNPLYNAFMFVWVRVFGDSEVSIRVPSLVAGYAVVWMVWRWARERLGVRVAFVAAAWLLISPVPVWYSAEAKNSIFSVLTSVWVLTSHDALLRADAGERRRQTWTCLLASVLAILTDFQTLLIVAPVWTGVGIEALRRGRIDPQRPRGLGRSLALVIVGTLLALSPLLYLKATHFGELPRDYPDLFHLRAMLWFLCIWMPIGTVLPTPRPGWWPLTVASTGVVLLPLTAMGLAWLWRESRARLVVLSFVFPLVFYLVVSWVLHDLMGDKTRIYQDRNIIVLMPWYAVVLAAGIESLHRPWLRGVSAALFLGGAFASSVLIDTVLDESWTVMTPNPDWRRAAEIVDAAPGRALVLSRTAMLPMRYYSKDSELIEFDKSAPPAQEIANKLADRGEREFFLISDPWWSGLKPDELPEIDRAFPLEERIELKSLVIERRRRGGSGGGDGGGGGGGRGP